MSLTYRRISFVVGLFLIVALASGALTTRTSAQANAAGRLRFVHAIPGAPAVDVLVDKSVAAAGLAYASASRFITVPAGDHAVTVAAGGKSLLVSKVSVAAGQAQTVVVEGTAAAPEAAVYEDDLGPVAAGNTRLTASHAIKGGPSVDVVRGDGSPLIQGLKYATPYGAFDIPATTVSIAVIPSGGSLDAAVLKVDKLPLIAGTHNRLVALGTTDGSVKPSYLLLTAAADADNPASATLVRFVHASPDAPAVDVFVGDKLVAPNVAFGSYTPHLALASGAADVSIRAAGSGASGAALASTKLTLAAGKAVTVAVMGPSDGLTFVSSEDNVSALKPTTARLHLINAAGGTASLKVGKNVNASATSAQPDSKGSEIAAGVYDVAVSVDNPAISLKASQALSGGVLYDIIVAGNKPEDLIVAATALNEQPGSAPANAPVAVAQAGAPTAAATAAAPAQAQPTAAATKAAATTAPATAAPTEVAAQPTAQPPAATAVPPTAVPPTAVPPTDVPPPPATAPAGATATAVPPTKAPQPAAAQGIIALVQTNEGVNLKIREYPRVDARTLALVPSGSNLVVTGLRGPLPPATGEPTFTPAPTSGPTATLSSEGVKIEGVWLYVTWQTPDGGNVTGWINAQYVKLTRNGKPVKDVADIYTFKLIPPTTAGEVNSSSVTPIAVNANSIIGTIQVDEGRNLQLRRTPGIDGESLALVPAGAQVTVVSKTEVKSKGGVVGEPASTTWLYVRFDTDTGTVIGWINQQYVKLTRNQKTFALEDVPTATTIERGFIQGNATAVKPPAAPGLIATVNKVNQGANLQLRNLPNAGGESLALIPAGTELQVLGRNGDANWLSVRFGDKQGWINQQYVTVTRGGKPFKVTDISNITTEKDTSAQATPGPTPTATQQTPGAPAPVQPAQNLPTPVVPVSSPSPTMAS